MSLFIRTLSSPRLSCSLRSFSSSSHFIDYLSSRGFLSSTTHSLPQLRSHFSVPRTIYAGFDPTASSLHLGNYLILRALQSASAHGHQVIALLGGSTALIGDPSGRATDRPALQTSQVSSNTESIHRLIRVHTPNALIINNSQWFSEFSLLEFLRTVGSHFRVSSMLAKESVANRLAAGRNGISFTEFSYQLFQAFDFYHLSKNYQVTVQIGGSDQYGNITAGMELIHKLKHESSTDPTVFGMTFPLLTTSSGEKFGKSSGNAMWIDSSLTSPYKIYQYFMHTNDTEISKFMKLFTDLSLEQIENAEKTMKGQKEFVELLAFHATKALHGEQEALKAQQSSELLFGAANSAEEMMKLSSEQLLELFSGVPQHPFTRSQLLDQPLVDLLLIVKAVKSKGEARRLIPRGAISINGRKVNDETYKLKAEDLLDKRMILLAVGKRGKFLAVAKDSE
jgi:tyrosyl-tRNA synthetase